MNKDNRELNDNELKDISGAGECFNNITIGNIEGSLTSENIMGITPSSKTLATEQSSKSDAPVVGCFVGLPGLP